MGNAPLTGTPYPNPHRGQIYPPFKHTPDGYPLHKKSRSQNLYPSNSIIILRVLFDNMIYEIVGPVNFELWSITIPLKMTVLSFLSILYDLSEGFVSFSQTPFVYL